MQTFILMVKVWDQAVPFQKSLKNEKLPKKLFQKLRIGLYFWVNIYLVKSSPDQGHTHPWTSDKSRGNVEDANEDNVPMEAATFLALLHQD